MARVVITSKTKFMANIDLGLGKNSRPQKDATPILQDIAITVGGQVISEELGIKLEEAELSMLGRAARAAVSPSEAAHDLPQPDGTAPFHDAELDRFVRIPRPAQHDRDFVADRPLHPVWCAPDQDPVAPDFRLTRHHVHGDQAERRVLRDRAHWRNTGPSSG